MGKASSIILAIVLTAAVSVGLTYYFVNKDSEVNQNFTEKTTTSTPRKSAITTNTATSSVVTNNVGDSKKEICSQLFKSANYVEVGNETTNAVIGEEQCLVTTVSGDYAIGGTGQVMDESGGGPGAAWLAAKIGNNWIKIQATQDTWQCDLLEQYRVPEELLQNDGSCYDIELNKTREYVQPAE